METTPAISRALVLGGGGSTGNAWLIGIIAGLFDTGLDVTDADVTIGTSAGATAAAQLIDADPVRLYEDILASSAPPLRTGRSGPTINHLDRTAAVISASADAADMRRRMGASALELDVGLEHSERWRAICAARFSARDWTERAILLTAVDARSGEPVVFDRFSGVALVDAVAASTSGGPPYALGNERYIDGGYRANAENADLGAGYDRVLVLSPFGGRTRLPLTWHLDLATQVHELQARGSRVETIFPAAEFEHLFGANGMDLSLRPSAARAGFAQGTAAAAYLSAFWR